MDGLYPRQNGRPHEREFAGLVVARNCLDGEMERHKDRVTLEGRHALGYLVPAGRKSGNIPPGMQQNK